MPLDSRPEKRDGSGHEHRCGHAFATDVTDDERDIIAIPVEVIQVASDTLHRHQRSMEGELRIIDEIVRQDTSLYIPRNIHLVLYQFMLILHLEVCFLVQFDPAEKPNEHDDADNQDKERDMAAPFDAMPDDMIRNGNHQLHVDRVHRLRINAPAPCIVPVLHLILRRAVVRRSDDGAVRAVKDTNRFFMRLDIMENILNPLNREIIAHNT